MREKAVLENFYLISKWRCLVDIVFLMTANQTVALEREHKNLLTEKHGSIMEPGTLQTLVDCFHGTFTKHGRRFRHAELIDTSGLTNIECGERVVRTTLQVLNSMIAM